MSARKSQSPKTFTVEQANAALPLIQAIVSDLAGLSCKVSDRRECLSVLLARHEPTPNDPYREELAQVQEELEKDSRRLQNYVEELRELGVEPKSPTQGLVDFPAIINGRKIYLCWQLGEPEILFWHELDAGFQGRQPLATAGLSGGETPVHRGSDPKQ